MKRRVLKKKSIEELIQISVASGVPGVSFVPTSPTPLSHVVIDLREESFEQAVERIKKEVTKGAIVKIDLTVIQSQLGAIDLNLLREAALGKARFVRQIVPIIIRDTERRIKGQSPELSMRDAALHFLKAKSPKRKREIYKLALEILGE